MSNRTEDSTMSNLRELMAMESQRAETEQRTRLEVERDRNRRAVEERARIEEAARKHTLEAESARMEAERIRRAAEERVEHDRLASELKIRLAAEQKARLDAQAADLARREQLAELAARASQSRGVSAGTAAALIGLALAAVGVAGFALHQQSVTRAQIAAMQHEAPLATTPVRDNSDLRAAIANANARATAAASGTPVPRPAPAPSNGPRPRHHASTVSTAQNSSQSEAGEIGQLLESGHDPITDTGLEGGGTRRRNRR
jgi:hypothetical protein